MYAEASKTIAEPRVSLANAAPKLKNAFRSERHQAERETWQRELEVSFFQRYICSRKRVPHLSQKAGAGGGGVAGVRPETRAESVES